MKRILVTGGHGFLGKRVLAEFERNLSENYCIDSFRSAEFDLRNPLAVVELLNEKRPDVVVHLAAKVGGIGANREFPGTLFYDNLVMGTHLIESCRKTGVEHFILAGTVCSYPKFCQVPFREKDLWSGFPEETNAPYGVAKKALLVQLDAYRSQFGFNSTNLLLVNLYGPGDNFDLESSHVIPAMLRKFYEAKIEGATSATLWGDGTASREFLFVDDAARAIRLAVQSGPVAQPVNVGCGVEVSMKDLAELVKEVVGFSGGIVWDKSKPNGQPRRCLDVNTAREVLGFAAEMRLLEGLQLTYQWFLENYDQIKFSAQWPSGPRQDSVGPV